MISNPLHFMWIFYSFAVNAGGVYELYFHKHTPNFFSKIFKFGKLNKDGEDPPHFVQLFEVPKRWFAHFYIFSSIFFFSTAVIIWKRYSGPYSPTFMIFLLDTFADINRQATVIPEAVVISSFLIVLQAFRRFYECHFVSIYSEAKMNVAHYIMGLTYYFGVGLSLISDAPGFLHNDDASEVEFSNSWFSWNHIIGVSLFFFGFILQGHTNIQLANLRKNKDGNKVVTLGHLMPTGICFDFVSCPHFFAEIVMYFSVSIIMQSISWWLLCLFTTTNQTILGLLNHKWYKSYFKSYPSTRKAVIPYLI